MPQGQVSDISLKTDNTIQEITNNINLNIGNYIQLDPNK